jgi:trehalose 6-phosphate synthase
MSRLVVVSNRVADLEKNVQSGGLAVALGDALRQSGGLWFGWDGKVCEDGAALETNVAKKGSVTVATVPLTRSDYEEYYIGFSNQLFGGLSPGQQAHRRRAGRTAAARRRDLGP